MEFEQYDFEEFEEAVLTFWRRERLREHANQQNAQGEPFYFLDGPPYTTGKVHLGTTWNKSMKDAVLRLRRMQGFAVWDRAGYDMHGLPTENGVMRELGLTTKEDVEEYGVERFSKYCRDWTIRNLEQMNADFERIGVWMDFEDAYRTISEEWIEGIWWLLKKVHAEGRLYEGLRPMYWDPEHETALAKHELEYREVEDQSIYVKFKRVDADEYFIVWTTTPWTIPFNLMIMAHPEISYARVRAGEETWIVAEDLVESVLEAAEAEGEVLETLPGADLVGVAYEHFFSDQLPYADLKREHPKVHTVVASAEYVTTEAGTGLVHAAPGCGPEDYEVGVREDVPAWNLLDERGRYPADAGIFGGVRARFEDERFTEAIAERGALLAVKPYLHDYPFAERSKSPIVYKTTKQWFFRINDLKEQMIAQNKEVNWVPEAGFNAFNSWLENLRDNSVTKQRFWGTPFPVWRNVDDPDDIIVVGSKRELEELSGSTLTDLHKPWIDAVVIERDGKRYERLPDVLDVWLDAGSASWNCLRYPADKEAFERYFPADFIIEGNDQIRGWFNLLMVASTLAFGKAPFKNVYMHGMINDAKGRKMSKSEGNYILPEEVIPRYGVDAMRLFMIGGTKAGNDLTYAFDEIEATQRSLRVYWNIHRYLLDLSDQLGVPEELPEALEVEDRYILSRAHSAAKQVQELLDAYRIERIPTVVRDLLDEISRTYIQLVRPIVQSDDEAGKRRVLSVLHHAFDVGLRLLAPLAPFATEAIWQNLRGAWSLDVKSVHLRSFPTPDERRIDAALEESFERAQQVISVLLAARDKARIGVRWPLSDARIAGVESLSDDVRALILQQVNLRSLTLSESLEVSYVVAPNYRAIGKEYGEKTAEIATALKERSAELGAEFADKGSVTVAGETLGPEYLAVQSVAPDGFVFAEDQGVRVLLCTEQSADLLREGFVRELARRVQQLRKEAGLEKADRIRLVLADDLEELVSPAEEDFSTLVGAASITYATPVAAPHQGEETVRDRTLRFGFSVE